MARRKQIKGFAIKSAGIVLMAVLLWFWGNSESNSKTISFRNKTFDVYSVEDIKSIHFYLNDSVGNKLNNFESLKNYTSSQGKELLLAMNGGMYTPNFEPQGLYIENGSVLNNLNTASGYGNFYLLPNGVFGITRNNHGFVVKTEDFQNRLPNTRFATQSGPMLVFNDSIHPAFSEGSKNLHIRNGVGVTNSGKVVLVISNQRTNFYDFALLFRDKLHCSNALYLDGAISKMYNKATNRTEDGSFGVMIGIVK